MTGVCRHGEGAVRHYTPGRDYWVCRFCEEVVCVECYVAHTNERHEPPPAPLTCPCCNDIRNRRPEGAPARVRRIRLVG
jgi:hypothetical protein